MRELKGHIIPETKFCFPFRMILAGSSGSGKTHFAGRLLADKELFEDQISSIVYYYPCYLEKAPVRWHKTMDVPVSYQVGLPTKDDLIKLPKRTCVVLDDSYDEAINSKSIDHLFRVISGKRKISVIIMTQNNFSKGRYGRDIRNSCNFAVLFRNCCDTSINENIARMAGLSKAYNAAAVANENVKYPYMFIDQSQQGQLSNYRLYTDIYSANKVVWSVDGMKGYVVAAQDFESFFDVFSDDKTYTAVKNANETNDKPENYWDSESESETPPNPTYYKPDNKSKPQKTRTTKQESAKCGKHPSDTEDETETKRRRSRKRERSVEYSDSETECERKRAKENRERERTANHCKRTNEHRKRGSPAKYTTSSESSDSDRDNSKRSRQYRGPLFQN